ncbi:MAG: hypothetical protein ACRDNZ_01020 [Streptosporangiaceae bacterium]
MRLRSADGRWRVDLIRLSCTSDHRDGEHLRISWDGYYIAEVRTLDELSTYLNPAELEEALARGWPAATMLQVR